MFSMIAAFLCAGLGQLTPTADAASMPGMTMATDSGGSTPPPCKSSIPNCVTDIGCIFMVALPLAYTPTVAQHAWSRIFYASTTASHAGMSLEPDLGPPIHA